MVIRQVFVSGYTANVCKLLIDLLLCIGMQKSQEHLPWRSASDNTFIHSDMCLLDGSRRPLTARVSHENFKALPVMIWNDPIWLIRSICFSPPAGYAVDPEDKPRLVECPESRRDRRICPCQLREGGGTSGDPEGCQEASRGPGEGQSEETGSEKRSGEKEKNKEQSSPHTIE